MANMAVPMPSKRESRTSCRAQLTLPLLLLEPGWCGSLGGWPMLLCPSSLPWPSMLPLVRLQLPPVLVGTWRVLL
eukprot:7914413-Heterocapsa_arctica.AAC.1